MLMRIVDQPDKTFTLEVVSVYEATEKQVKYALIDAEKWWKGARHKASGNESPTIPKFPKDRIGIGLDIS